MLIQPKKSGNYSIELTLYSSEGYLQDYYYDENLFVDLNLPDLNLDMPLLMSETSEGAFSHVKGVDVNDNFFITGQVGNLGTVNANNVTLKIEYEGKEKILTYSGLHPGEKLNWTLSNEELLSEDNPLGTLLLI